MGLVIIDEQHKFGVRQRIELSNKGGKNCDLLIDVGYSDTSSTLVILAIYGDMDVSTTCGKTSTTEKDIITLK